MFQTDCVENFPGSRIGFFDNVSFQRLEGQRGRSERGRSIECQVTQSTHQIRTNLVLPREQVLSFSLFWHLQPNKELIQAHVIFKAACLPCSASCLAFLRGVQLQLDTKRSEIISYYLDVRLLYVQPLSLSITMVPETALVSPVSLHGLRSSQILCSAISDALIE